MEKTLAILGAGNIGLSIAYGLLEANVFRAEQMILTRRHVALLAPQKKQGFEVLAENQEAVRRADIVLIAVEPKQVDGLLREIGMALLPSRHLLISVVSGVRLRQIKEQLDHPIPVIRAMPNTAIAIRESMTCLAVGQEDPSALETAQAIFNSVGKTLVISEEQMTSATALGACGIAFFLRAIRAASQGGIEIGFHAGEALLIASQTAKGAADLLLKKGKHPEDEIDKVTTPRGCTISGLNQMEYEGFSSSMIKGITTSAQKAATLYAATPPPDEKKSS